jgi:hypothetical protein
MRLNTKQISLFFLVLLLCGLAHNSNATHISEPILSEPKTEYILGEKIVLNGWVSYNDEPTADVLLNFKVILPDGTAASEQSYPSDSSGHFAFEFDTSGQVPGTYQVTITSHCLEIHRPFCTYKNQTISINVIESNSR